MSVMMGFGGQNTAASNCHGEPELLYTGPSECALNKHPLNTHDSGIDITSHELDTPEPPPTQPIEYHDASSSSDSRASFSDTLSMSLDDYSPQLRPDNSGLDKPPKHKRRRSPPKTTIDLNDNSLVSVYTFFKTFLGASTASTVAIDNKIEQAMDLVKSHLMFAVREEVDVLKDRIVDLVDRVKHLECENSILRQYASPDVLQQIQSQMPPQIQQNPHHSSN